MVYSSPFAKQNDKGWGAHHGEGSMSTGQDRGAANRAGRRQWCSIGIEGGGDDVVPREEAQREAVMAWHQRRGR
jgi:hypothetical protein